MSDVESLIPTRVKIAVFASGRGTNFEAIADAIQRQELHAEITSVVCDRPGAEVIERARARGIRAHVVPPTDVSIPGGDIAQRRNRHEEVILERLGPEEPRWLVFAGYMRILGDRLIEQFRSPAGSAVSGPAAPPAQGSAAGRTDRLSYSRIVNVHPSLLPSFAGKGSYAQAFDYGCAVAGVTVHLVEKEVDAGPIAAQEAFGIADCRSADEVEARGLEVEHRLYPRALAWLLSENFEIMTRQSPMGRRLCVRSR